MREQKPLDRHVAVAGFLGDFLRLVEDACERGREIDLAGAAAGHLWNFGERRLDGAQAPRANCRRNGRSGPAASPSGSSSRTLSRCSGANCWWPSRSARLCADWTKPRARSVYFSKSIVSSLGLSLSPRGADGTSSWGSTRRALTLVKPATNGSRAPAGNPRNSIWGRDEFDGRGERGTSRRRPGPSPYCPGLLPRAAKLGRRVQNALRPYPAPSSICARCLRARCMRVLTVFSGMSRIAATSLIDRFW